MSSILAWIKAHLGMTIGALAGLLVAVLFLIIGFFPTLLIIILVGIGAAIGGIESVRTVITGWFKKIFNK